jgi:hypothetical protein
MQTKAQPHDAPTACSLTAEDAARQGDAFAAICRRSLIEVDRDERVLTFRFGDDEGVRDELEAYVAVESKCCGFLDFVLAREDGANVLAITAAEGTPAAVLHSMYGSPRDR